MFISFCFLIVAALRPVFKIIPSDKIDFCEIHSHVFDEDGYAEGQRTDNSKQQQASS